VKRLCVCLGLGLLGCQPAALRTLDQGFVLEPGIAKPELILTATDGRAFDFRRDTEGRAVLLFFGYTHCPDVCPVQMANISAGLAKVAPGVRQAVQVIFVTTDPRRDTGEVLRAWLDHFDRSFVGLRGDSATIAQVMRTLRLGEPIIIPGTADTTYTVSHAAMVLGFSRDNLAHVAYPFGLRQESWARNIPSLVNP
jgi:protein SCO1